MDQHPRSRAARPFPKTLTYRIEGDVLKLALVGKRNDDYAVLFGKTAAPATKPATSAQVVANPAGWSCGTKITWANE